MKTKIKKKKSSWKKNHMIIRMCHLINSTLSIEVKRFEKRKQEQQNSDFWNHREKVKQTWKKIKVNQSETPTDR
jgi:hypothetical protein